MTVVRQGQSHLKPQYIAPTADPNSDHWRGKTNTVVLPVDTVGETHSGHLKAYKKPMPATLKDPPPVTPVAKHGSVIGDDGQKVYYSGRNRSGRNSKGKK